MLRSKGKPSSDLIAQALGEASWLLSHAQALADYRREEEATAELFRAASCEEQAACLLEAGGQDEEAAIHRVSAASCYEKLGQHVRAVTLLRAALSGPMSDAYRIQVEQQRRRCLAQTPDELKKIFKRRARGQSSPS